MAEKREKDLEELLRSGLWPIVRDEGVGLMEWQRGFGEWEVRLRKSNEKGKKIRSLLCIACFYPAAL